MEHFTHRLPRLTSWTSPGETVDAVLLFVALVALCAAVHTLVADYLFPWAKHVCGFGESVSDGPEAVLHAPIPSQADARVDEKLDHHTAAAAPAPLESRVINPAAPGFAPPQVADLGADLRAAAASALHDPPTTDLRAWLATHRPFATLTREAVDATWPASPRTAHEDQVRRLHAHLEMASGARAKCVPLLASALDRLGKGALTFSQYLDLVVRGMCLEEAWDLLGHFQFIAIHPSQLRWIHATVEAWRRSDDGLLCGSPMPLFASGEALLSILASPRQGHATKLAAMYELAALPAAEWPALAGEHGALDLLAILARGTESGIAWPARQLLQALAKECADG
ncbi:hypothetical protein H9P43_009401 [Blastocladiella emersonii ATCC 22665]|nr:hypothetical protein H9P43_009401 [Blastocladiella emersonii ATCC 22665]